MSQPHTAMSESALSESRGTVRAVVPFITMSTYCIAVSFWIIAGSPRTLLQMVPDDAFYYVGVARNLAQKGLSSCDGGQTATTGYHPLWAWLLAVLNWLVGRDDQTYVRAAVALSAGLSLTVLGSWGWSAWRARRYALLYALAIGASSSNFLRNMASAMEWSLVVACHGTFLALLLSGFRYRSRYAVVICFFVLGCATTLARTDYGLVPFAFLAAAILIARVRRDASFVWPAAGAAAGAVGGFLLACCYTFAISGHWIQGSARMKALWGTAAAFNPKPVIVLILRSMCSFPLPSELHLSLPFAAKLALPAVVLVVGIAMLLKRRSAIIRVLLPWFSRLSSAELLALTASLTIVPCYFVAYSSHLVGVQVWYSVHFTCPLCCITYFALRFMIDLGHHRIVSLASWVLCLSGMALLPAIGGSYPGQEENLAVGRTLRQHLSHERIGASDSGIVGFYQGGDIINLDGLANDEIHDYAPDRLHCYLGDKRIRFFTGFGTAAETSFHLVDYAMYSTLVGVATLPNGNELRLRRVDFSRLPTVGCGLM